MTQLFSLAFFKFLADLEGLRVFAGASSVPPVLAASSSLAGLASLAGAFLPPFLPEKMNDSKSFYSHLSILGLTRN